MLQPQQCANMQEIRTKIDAIDQQIIALLGQRAGYVAAASAFKIDADSVRAQSRVDAMLKQRREWAEKQGLSPDMVEQLYRLLVEHFIALEMQQWKTTATHR